MDLSPATSARIDQAAAAFRELLAEYGIANTDGTSNTEITIAVTATFLCEADPDISVAGLIAHAAVQRILGALR